MTPNPILAELTRGGIIESFHRGAFAVVNATGDVVLSGGDINRPIYPRSAIKAFQAMPCLQTGAADHYGFSAAELSVACSSHNGEPIHIDVVQSMLEKSGIDQTQYECGPFWPSLVPAALDLSAEGKKPTNVHNECSGKHAAMMATAKYLDEDIEGYSEPTHPVQIRIRDFISELCQYDMKTTSCGIDGCSVPTWSMPLKNLATGFAQLAVYGGVECEWKQSAKKLIASVREEPYMVAGKNSFSTVVMEAVPRLFAKTGAEGVMCGLIEHAGLGIAVKMDDGAVRGAEVIFAQIAAELGVWNQNEQSALKALSRKPILNRRKIETGTISACTVT